MNKNLIQRRKFKYYLMHSVSLIIPRLFFRIKMKYELKKINNYNSQYLKSRVNYYNKIIENFQLGEDAINIDTLFNLQIEKFIGKIFKKKKLRKELHIFLTYIIIYHIFLLF